MFPLKGLSYCLSANGYSTIRIMRCSWASIALRGSRSSYSSCKPRWRCAVRVSFRLVKQRLQANAERRAGFIIFVMGKMQLRAQFEK